MGCSNWAGFQTGVPTSIFPSDPPRILRWCSQGSHGWQHWCHACWEAQGTRVEHLHWGCFTCSPRWRFSQDHPFGLIVLVVTINDMVVSGWFMVENGEPMALLMANSNDLYVMLYSMLWIDNHLLSVLRIGTDCPGWLTIELIVL